MMALLTQEELDRLWDADSLVMSPEQSKLLPALRRWLARHKDDPIASLLSGGDARGIDLDATRILSANMAASFRPFKRAVAALQLLGKVVDHGNECGLFQLCPPPVPFLQKKQASPFAEKRWGSLDVAQRLRDALSGSLGREEGIGKLRLTQEARLPLGRLLVSAVVHGGLLHASQLESLVKRLAGQGPVLDCVDERTFVELSLCWKQQEDAEFRRWFPDPLSAILLLKLDREALPAVLNLDEENHGSLRMSIWRAVAAFLKHAGIPATGPMKSLATVLDAVRLDLDTRLPPVLVHYASRTFVSHSTKPDVWLRIHGLASTSPPSAPDPQRALPEHGITADVTDLGEIEPRWLARLRKAMAGLNRDLIIGHIEKLLAGKGSNQVGSDMLESFAPGTHGALFAGFALRMMSRCGQKGDKFAVTTAKAYVFSAAKRLGGIMGSADVSGFGPGEWAGLYEELLDDAGSAGMRRKIVRVLREFQAYLEIEHGVDTPDAEELFGRNDGLVPVDANVITPDEFARIRERLDKDLGQRAHGELKEVAWLVVTLAYRCGLRRMEVLKLELADICIKHPAELLVRPTEARGLKTKNSTRKIPLYALLEAEELERLKAWLEKRREDEKIKAFSNFLFSIPRDKFTFVPQDTLFRRLHPIMRDVTGDATLRFHHLRHSFASWCFLRLMASDLHGGVSVFRQEAATRQALEKALSLRQALYGNTRLTRRHVWAVSSLLGHSGPDISLEHYIHFADICLAEHLAVPDLAPSPGDILLLAADEAGRHNPAWVKDHANQFVAEIWARQHPDIVGSRSRRKPESDNNAPVEQDRPDEADTLDRIWNMLHQHGSLGVSLEELVERFGMAAGLVGRYLDNARWLSLLRLSEKGSQYRHRFMDFTPDRRSGDKVRIACPIRPHERRDLDIIDELAPRLRKAMIDAPQLASSVLRHYADHSIPGFPGMIFKDPEQPGPAKDFLEWLKALGLQGSDLRFVCFDATSQRSRPLAKWKKALDLNWRARVDRIPPLNGRKDWACPWLGIEPVFPEGADGRMTGSSAFRFIMVMGIITHKWARPLNQPELVILCGLPASGKTTWYEQNCRQTHVHISRDILKRDAKVMEKFRACLQRRESMVIDNTNLTPEHRQHYVPEAKATGYHIVGIQFKPDLEVSLKRNRERNGKAHVPEKAIQKMHREMVGLSTREGFDKILVQK